MRRRLALLATLAATLAPQMPAMACGGLVSATGAGELRSFEAFLEHDGAIEDLLVTVFYAGTEEAESFAWLMPFPEAPEVSEGTLDPIEAARTLTAPPLREDHVPELLPSDESESAGGGPLLVDVTRVGDLEFATLGGGQSFEITGWMSEHGFAFHDEQEPVIQAYLDRGWVVVAARVAPGVAPTAGELTPVRFSFATPEPVYPLAIAGSTHRGGVPLLMELFVVTDERMQSATYPEVVVRPDDEGDFPVQKNRLGLRYSAPIEPTDATGLGVQPSSWLARYEAAWKPTDLTEDLVFERSPDQTAVDYRRLLDEFASARRWVYVGRAGLIGVPVLLIGGSVWMMARRRRRTAGGPMT